MTAAKLIVALTPAGQKAGDATNIECVEQPMPLRVCTANRQPRPTIANAGLTSLCSSTELGDRSLIVTMNGRDSSFACWAVPI